MFQLSKNEWKNPKTQFATLDWEGIRKLPYAFTEQGRAMLSGMYPKQPFRSTSKLSVLIQK